jgi:cytochrome c oxidase subunit 3
MYQGGFQNIMNNKLKKEGRNNTGIKYYRIDKMLLINNANIGLPNHPYHIVDQSPWPITLSGVLLSLTISAVLSFHGYIMGDFFLFCSFILLIWGMSLWFKDIITEASYLGAHTDKVQKGISLGVALFIISEVFFFLSIFWAYFHSSLAPAIEIGSEWPPKGIEAVNASEVPTANTTILLSSGSSVTVSHHSLVDRLISWANYGSIATIYMAFFFTGLQILEYFGVSYTITDSVFGSTFYLGTGLILGPIILFIYINIYTYNFLKETSSQTISSDIITDFLIINESEKSKGISPYLITGFADAESSFVIRVTKTNRKYGWRIMPIFSIELHIKDLSLLKEIQSYFEVGKIHIRIREGRTSVIYSVQSRIDLYKRIIPHFSEYPLLTQKRIDFNFFLFNY